MMVGPTKVIQIFRLILILMKNDKMKNFSTDEKFGWTPSLVFNRTNFTGLNVDIKK